MVREDTESKNPKEPEIHRGSKQEHPKTVLQSEELNIWIEEQERQMLLIDGAGI